MGICDISSEFFSSPEGLAGGYRRRISRLIRRFSETFPQESQSSEKKHIIHPIFPPCDRYVTAQEKTS